MISLSVCMRRRNVRLELQQPGMERRRINSTRYLSYQRRLQWRIEWQFPGADDVRISDARYQICFSSASEAAGRGITQNMRVAMVSP